MKRRCTNSHTTAVVSNLGARYHSCTPVLTRYRTTGVPLRQSVPRVSTPVVWVDVQPLCARQNVNSSSTPAR